MKLKFAILMFLLLPLQICGSREIEELDRAFYKRAVVLYSNGKIQEAKKEIERLSDEALNSSQDALILAALIEESLGNNAKCIEILERGWKSGHEVLICPLALYQFNDRNFKWLKTNEARLMRAIAKKVDNYHLAFRALYCYGVVSRDVQVLRNVMSQVSDEEIMKDPELAPMMLELHTGLLEAAAQSTINETEGTKNGDETND